MVAERQVTLPLSTRRGTRQRANEQNRDLDQAALRAVIRALWRKERQLCSYSPVDELCLDLEGLELEALHALRGRILTRLQAHIAAQNHVLV